jgi:3-methylcrotonyl-CoA carboxylase alpha subunit
VAEHEVRVGDSTRRIDDRQFAIERIAEGVYSVSDGKRRWRVVVAGAPAERWVFVDGRVAQIEIVDETHAPRRFRTAVHDMSAPMPATVVKVLVEPGAHVTRGDTVVMLEAMKMELPVKAARDGVVRAVRCQSGELVQPGVNLVELEP